MDLTRTFLPSLLVAGLLAAAGAGCSSKKEPAFPDEAKATGASDDEMKPSPAKESLPPGTVARTDLDLALMRGPGWLLSKVHPEEVLRQNKFIGWRLVAFPADWDGSGLQPGDVVTDVNGTPLERPEDLWTAWMAATEASEIKIGYERDGKPAVSVLKIHGPVQPDTKKSLEAGVMAAAPKGPTTAGGGAGKPGQPSGKQRFETKVIQGSQEPIETSEY